MNSTWSFEVSYNKLKTCQQRYYYQNIYQQDIIYQPRYNRTLCLILKVYWKQPCHYKVLLGKELFALLPIITHKIIYITMNHPIHIIYIPHYEILAILFHKLLDCHDRLVSTIVIRQRNSSSNIERSLSETGGEDIRKEMFCIQSLPCFRNLLLNMLLCCFIGNAWMLLHVVFCIGSVAPHLFLILYKN